MGQSPLQFTPLRRHDLQLCPVTREPFAQIAWQG
jgi:hypothetical protein